MSAKPTVRNLAVHDERCRPVLATRPASPLPPGPGRLRLRVRRSRPRMGHGSGHRPVPVVRVLDDQWWRHLEPLERDRRGVRPCRRWLAGGVPRHDDGLLLWSTQVGEGGIVREDQRRRAHLEPHERAPSGLGGSVLRMLCGCGNGIRAGRAGAVLRLRRWSADTGTRATYRCRRAGSSRIPVSMWIGTCRACSGREPASLRCRWNDPISRVDLAFYGTADGGAAWTFRSSVVTGAHPFGPDGCRRNQRDRVADVVVGGLGCI